MTETDFWPDEKWLPVGNALEGRVAVVTGGAKGIGRGIALSLGAQSARVVVADIDLDQAQSVADEVTALGGHGCAVRLDVGNVQEIESVLVDVATRLGGLDIQVNNAGVAQAKPMWDITEDDWDWMNTINQKGLFFCCSTAVRIMKDQGRGGVIINLSSMAGREAVSLYSHYSATKFAAIGITQSIAKEASEFNIRAHAICPGIVLTPLWKKNLDELSANKGISREAAWAEFTDSIPLGRAQTAKDIGDLAAFLSSDSAHNMTGQAFNVSGGRTIH